MTQYPRRNVSGLVFPNKVLGVKQVKFQVFMNLNELSKNNYYQIEELTSGDTALLNRLTQLGFYPGEKIRLKRVAPLFKDPLLFEVGETHIAISLAEAKEVKIKAKELQC